MMAPDSQENIKVITAELDKDTVKLPDYKSLKASPKELKESKNSRLPDPGVH